jgi:hypothetical protein
VLLRGAERARGGASPGPEKLAAPVQEATGRPGRPLAQAPGAATGPRDVRFRGGQYRARAGRRPPERSDDAAGGEGVAHPLPICLKRDSFFLTPADTRGGCQVGVAGTPQTHKTPGNQWVSAPLSLGSLKTPEVD